MGWQDLVAVLTSVAFGVVSAVVPIANAETYVVAAQVARLHSAVAVAVAIGVGQSFGKLLLFAGVRRSRDFPFVRRHVNRPIELLPLWRQRLRRILDNLLVLVGTKRWGLPIVALAAVTGIPPLYAVALLAGATRMRALWFWLVVLGGRVARFVLIALGVGHGVDWWQAP